MKVIKFGGTSVANADAIKRTAEIVSGISGKKIIVVSALAGITDLLTSICDDLERFNYEQAEKNLRVVANKHLNVIRDLVLDDSVIALVHGKITEFLNYIDAIKVLGEISLRTRDIFLSLGEILSSNIIAAYYKKCGIVALWSDTGKMIKTDSTFSRAKINQYLTDECSQETVKNLFAEADSIVCGGFFGSDTNNEITTLGRGGSDHSAAIIARAVKAESLEIYTDVPGIMSCDPRIVPNAHTLQDVSYQEAAELAISGAKVLHPSTIAPAVENEIPVYVRDTFHPEHLGTKISAQTMQTKVLKAIAISKPLVLIKLKFTEKDSEFNDLVVLTGIMEKYGFSTKAMTLQNNSMTIAIDSVDETEELFFLAGLTADYQVIEHVTAISLIGENVSFNKELSTKILQRITESDIPLIYLTLSDINITCFVPEHRAKDVAISLHEFCV